jgi:hypothetical protein
MIGSARAASGAVARLANTANTVRRVFIVDLLEEGGMTFEQARVLIWLISHALVALGVHPALPIGGFGWSYIGGSAWHVAAPRSPVPSMRKRLADLTAGCPEAEAAAQATIAAAVAVVPNHPNGMVDLRGQKKAKRHAVQNQVAALRLAPDGCRAVSR